MEIKVYSPIPVGSGAYVVHKTLAFSISGYKICGYHPYWTFFPPVLPFICNNHRMDIVHTTPDYALFFQKKNVPLIITFHNYVLDAFMEPYSSLAQRIHYKTDLLYFTLKSLSAANAITCVSQFTADLVRKELGCNSDIHVIYNGIDAKVFSPIKKTQRSKKIKVLFSGNLTKRKGVDLLPDIAAKLDPGIEIIYTQGLRTKASLPPSDRMRNIGAVQFYDMPQVYQGADLLLFPTVREGLSLAAAEAMACSLPVVATNCSSMPELIVHGKGGYLCRLGDVDEFADRINQLAASPSLRHEMGQFNRTRIEESFTVEKMVEGYRQLFSEQVDLRGRKLA